jgi:acetyl-CoA acetyltransferase
MIGPTLDAAITGVGYTDFTRNSGRTVLELASSACGEAIADAGLRHADVDGIMCYHENDSALVRDVAAVLGLPRVRWYSDALEGGNYGCAIVGEAGLAAASGLARHVVVYRAMNGRSGLRMGEFGLHRADELRQFMLPYGHGSAPQNFAMVCQRYMHESGTTREQLARVAIGQREYARLNPRAIARDPLTLEAYLGARVIAEPLHLFDCCQETDGACAVVVSAGAAAAETPQPVSIEALASGFSAGGRYPFDRMPDFTRSWLADAAPELFAAAGIQPTEVDVAEIYDAFTFEVAMQLEDLGFCARGEGGAYLAAHGVGLDAELPINTHGGLLSEGYVHGLNHVCEAVLQLRGKCGERQVEGAEVAVVTSFSVGAGSALVLRGGSSR